MNYIEDRPDDPTTNLPAEEVAYLRLVLTKHANDPSTGTCPICGKRSCPDWRDAYDHLIVDGQSLADPRLWQSPDGRRR
ncbi:hypothetical protein [Krasilnikovia sp. M28-CT-15]|uniref:hypothetical protein n=1 Tax=Krasilnikovia sp. M28-CT-15 TaxID=3373540 RepID=UPI003876A46D